MVRDHIRTLHSLRRIPDTNVYVIDYYCDYNLKELRGEGMDPRQIEDSFIDAFFPEPIAAIAMRVKQLYVPEEINSVESDAHHCSTVTLRSQAGKVFFGRNFDWPHDACLIVRAHDDDGLASIAVIDLYYLNMDRTNLEETNLLERIPLLFAPYYVMDGMNRHGLAISEMSVDHASAPYDAQKPKIISATLMRVILDYAENTEDAVNLINEYNVCFPESQVHFMVSDAKGDSRIVEFIDGEVRVTGSRDSWQVCTNSVAWNRSELERDSSCSRYQVGSEHAQGVQGVIDHSDAIEATRTMAVDGWTMWTSVYELQSGEFRLLYKSRPDSEYRDVLPRSGDDEQTDEHEPE